MAARAQNVIRGANTEGMILEFLKVVENGLVLGALSANISATATSWTLTSATNTLDDGVWPVKVGSEIVAASQSGTTITVLAGTRGYLGTTAAAHLAGDSVTRATLSDLVSTRVYMPLSPKDVLNTEPMLVVNPLVGLDSNYNPKTLIRTQIKCYGGQDANKNRDFAASGMVDRALVLRFMTIDAPESVASGVVLSATTDGIGVPQQDPDIKPEWPYIQRFINFQVRGN